jgi:hypothetical protein
MNTLSIIYCDGKHYHTKTPGKHTNCDGRQDHVNTLSKHTNCDGRQDHVNTLSKHANCDGRQDHVNTLSKHTNCDRRQDHVNTLSKHTNCDWRQDHVNTPNTIYSFTNNLQRRRKRNVPCFNHKLHWISRRTSKRTRAHTKQVCVRDLAKNFPESFRRVSYLVTLDLILSKSCLFVFQPVQTNVSILQRQFCQSCFRSKRCVCISSENERSE